MEDFLSKEHYLECTHYNVQWKAKSPLSFFRQLMYGLALLDFLKKILPLSHLRFFSDLNTLSPVLQIKGSYVDGA